MYSLPVIGLCLIGDDLQNLTSSQHPLRLCQKLEDGHGQTPLVNPFYSISKLQLFLDSTFRQFFTTFSHLFPPDFSHLNFHQFVNVNQLFHINLLLKYFYTIWHPASPLWELVKNSVFSIFFIDIFDLTPLIIEFYCVFKKQNLKFFKIAKNINLNLYFLQIRKWSNG